ncbi:synaptonemal complex central element protein 1 [Zootoca vivipara]|uniref:synaptonemal complex central element protein 1 n=1 Tax=Zootoca vivipara TaxID=8524 RepID=UPI0015910066|nr:synaptonemal complex central element protein 1 [Zootoca vivipara]
MSKWSHFPYKAQKLHIFLSTLWQHPDNSVFAFVLSTDPWDFATKMEEILSLVKQMQNVEILEPKVEELVKRINKLQQAKKILSEELSEANEHSQTLQRELEILNAEKSSLEEIWSEMKGTRQIVQLHCEETETETQRQQKMNLERKQRIEELTAKIQEERVKQRDQRLEFEHLLNELMEKHKSLWELYAREKPAVADIREKKECLLSEEKMIQEKLAHAHEELDLISQSVFIKEREFLKSQEAATALKLFQEENKAAKEYLEAVSKYHSDLKQRCSR